MTAEAATVVTPTAMAAVVPAIMERPVIATVVMTTAATVVAEVAGPNEAVHHKGDARYRSIPLLARLRFAKNAPNDKDSTGHEPEKDRLSDLLRDLEKVTPPDPSGRDQVREQENRAQHTEHRTQQPHESDHDTHPSQREEQSRREAATLWGVTLTFAAAD